MEELLSIPVRLVVKAPNQKIADQTVECALDWTVRKLKEHLASVYPSKPLQNQQRIIYSGQLLQDDATLKEVLKQYEPNQMTHTVHLVCAPTTEAFYTPITTASSVPTVATSSAEGLRFRHNAAITSTPSSDTPQHPTTTLPGATPSTSVQVSQSQYTAPFGSYYTPQYNPYVHSYPPVSSPGPHLPYSTTHGVPQTFGATAGLMGMNAGGMTPFGAMGMASGMGPAMMGYGGMDAQTMWMQQAYAQYLSQYMQYYQQTAQAYGPHVSEPITTPQPPNQNAPIIPPVAAAVNPVPARAAAAANPGMRMNAQGGAVVDEDDDEEPNRDWLDWVYTLIRFAMLLCILYFYSNLSRFFMTLTFIMFIWLYQGGWLRLNRRARDQPQQQQAAGAAAAGVPQQAAAPAAELQQPQQNDLAHEEQQGNDAAARPVAPADSQPPNNAPDQSEPAVAVPGDVAWPPVAREPGPLMFAWNFVVAFFGSLAPQQPPAVNAN